MNELQTLLAKMGIKPLPEQRRVPPPIAIPDPPPPLEPELIHESMLPKPAREISQDSLESNWLESEQGIALAQDFASGKELKIWNEEYVVWKANYHHLDGAKLDDDVLCLIVSPVPPEDIRIKLKVGLGSVPEMLQNDKSLLCYYYAPNFESIVLFKKFLEVLDF
ncbi:MAG: hypothetical protein AB1861_03470 [Cyanobacteriota bacterium]